MPQRATACKSCQCNLTDANKYGRRAYCIPCYKVKNAQWANNRTAKRTAIRKASGEWGRRPPRVDHTKCGECGVTLDQSNITKNPNKSGWKCKQCANKRNAEWHKKNPEKSRNYTLRHNRRVRLSTFEVYGGKCVCCEEMRPEFLAIDHTEGGGNEERRRIGLGGIGFYKWLAKNGYPKGRYRILCHNCNMSHGFFGYCPHVEPDRFYDDSRPSLGIGGRKPKY